MSPSKKRHVTEPQVYVPDSSPQKKRMLKSEAEDMDASEIQDSQASTVLFEIEGNNLNSTKNRGKKNEIKVERNQHEENHISNNGAEENDVNYKSPNNDAEDSKASLSILLNDTTNNEDTPPKKKKKKKKKHRELEESTLENISEYIPEETLDETAIEQAEENSTVIEYAEENSTEVKKKKKKKKKHREDRSADEHVKDEEGNVDEDTQMTFEDTKRMFEDIQKKLLSEKHVSFKSFWDNYKFHPYSSKNCKMAFDKIMLKVQKKRTIHELVDAAGKMMEESPTIFCEKNFKLLKPVTPFKLFSQGHYKKLSGKHPEYRGIEILNKLSKKWRKLPDQKKLKYIDLALAKRPEYMEDVKHYQKIDSSFVARPILNKVEWQLKDRCAGLPEMPPRTGFYLFLQKSSDLYPDLSQKDRLKKLSADLKMLPAEVRDKYNVQVKEEKKIYDQHLKTYLDSLPPSDLEERNLTNKTKRTKTDPQERPISNFLQKKPPMSGYMLFFRELREELKDVPVIQRHVLVSEKWKALSEDERLEYNKRRLIQHDEWLKDLKSKINEEITESNDG